MALRIRIFGDPVLREKCEPLDKIDPEVRELMAQMADTLGASSGRVGLAAPQVGVTKRLFVYDLGRGPRCLINPEVIAGEGELPNEEGCLSFPGVYVTVPRYERVRTRCVTPSGHNIVIEAQDFAARLMQHECDHLDGVLIIDRCDAEERERALAEFRDMEERDALPDD
ncbi:MAG TPA: peptide deformylase [Candidatus Anoxymicrobiaceae bacterium]